MKKSRFTVLLLTVILITALSTVKYIFGSETKEGENMNTILFTDYDRFVATDGLGRTLPGYAEAGEVRENKYVGVFFHTWHDWDATRGSRNVQQIMDKNPDAVKDFNSPDWGTCPIYHWNEPVYNYYKNTDRWVLRKQAEMLANAGVDVVIFDNSNGATTYIDVVNALLEVFAEARADGVRTPQVSYLMNFFESGYEDTVKQLKQLYIQIYKPGKYKDLWFYWKGKPLVMAYPDKLNKDVPIEKEILDFFTFRPGQPSYTTGQQFQGQWGWLSIYPQQVYSNPDGTPEQITVGVAQNFNKKRGLTAMNGEGVFGRTYSGKLGGYDQRENAKLYGANFEEQFKYALEVDPEFIFITGWNEWVVGRYSEWCGVKNAFPDQFNDEYSRDIEPSLGDLKDHYYYQMIKYIRLFKGVKKPFNISKKKTIDINSDTDQWTDVFPDFYAYPGNTMERDSNGYLDNNTKKVLHYKNATGRNDIKNAKIARDADNIYFMAECTDDLTPCTDSRWMRLLLDIDGSGSNNWETFNYLVNRESPADKAVLEKSMGGWNWEKVGDIEYSVKGNRLQLKIPKAMLGIKDDNMVINFKWSDNMQNDGDIMDFYVNGDAAPGGRFKYQYVTNIDLIRKDSKMNLTKYFIAGGVVLLLGAISAVCFKKRKKRAK